MPYVDLPGVHLWYNDTGGTGVPVVFMHAASGTCESWVYQLPVCTAAGYRCIAYDRRNWGRSRPDLTGEQPGSVSDDLHGLVNHLGLARFHVVATAAGGIGGLDYAVEHPDHVRSLAGLTRTNQFHPMVAPAQMPHRAFHGQRHAVQFGRIGLGHVGNAHGSLPS